MQDFSCTKVISSLKSSVKECDVCKTIEVLKHQACKEMCLGNSEREQLLVAEKIKKTLGKPISSLLFKIFENPHADFSSRLRSLETNIDNLSEISKELPQISKKILNIAPNSEIERKTKFLEEKLNRLEDLLNTRAAEIYDLKEQVQELEIPKDDGVPIGDLTVYKEEIKKQFKILDDKKWANDQMKLDVIKLKKEKSSRVSKQKKEVEEEIGSIRKKNLGIEKQLERLEILQKGINERIRLSNTNIDTVTQKLDLITQDQLSEEYVTPSDLISISKNVFSSYKTMKSLQTKTKVSVNSCLDKLKQFSVLLPQIEEIRKEIERNSII